MLKLHDKPSFSETPPLPKSGLPEFKTRQHSLRLVARRQETPDIVTFEFLVLDGKLKHHPGQALALDIPLPAGSVTRTFTIASSGLDETRVSLSIKAGQSAHATRWLHDHLQLDTELKARGAFGRFTLASHPGRPLVLIGAGSGFTPMMSMLRWLYERKEQVDVAVIQVARHVEDLLYRDELDAIGAAMPTAKLFDVVTTPKVGERWRGYRGRPDRAMIRSMLPDVGQRVAFCCGPDAFMDQLRQVVSAEGGSPEDFLTETFGIAPVKKNEAHQDTSPQSQGHSVSLRGKSYTLSPTLVLSHALANEGIRIPTGCGEGRCGTCRLKLLDGEVDMEHNGGLSKREVEQGYILACCSRPKGALLLADPA